MKPPRLEHSIVLAKAREAINADKGLTTTGRALLLASVVVLAQRGYYKDSMGVPGTNDVGIWDDACWLVNLKTNEVIPYNWNTDPSRLGHNPGVGKGFAILQPGIWPFRKGQHKQKGPAWRQLTDDEADGHNLSHIFNDFRKDGSFKIWRGKIGAAEEIGYFAINIHWGGKFGTSSWGCQTAPESTWTTFRQDSYEATNDQKFLAYILADA